MEELRKLLGKIGLKGHDDVHKSCTSSYSGIKDAVQDKCGVRTREKWRGGTALQSVQIEERNRKKENRV